MPAFSLIRPAAPAIIDRTKEKCRIMTEHLDAGVYAASPEDVAQRLNPPPRADGRDTITALIITCDSETTIRQCMESVAWCDEIIVVVDPRSTDATERIVREFTDRVFFNEFTSDGLQRNFAIPKASCEWILVVDSDEIITAELRDDIIKRLRDNSGFDAFSLLRIAYFLGKPIKRCGWGRESQLRLFRRDKGRYDTRRIHAGVHVNGPAGRIDSFMLHNTIRDLRGYLNRFNDFTSWSSADLWDKGRRSGTLAIVVRPIMRFIKLYFLKLGFLEGRRGLLLCGFAAFNVFSKYAKLWEIQQNAQKDARP